MSRKDFVAIAKVVSAFRAAAERAPLGVDSIDKLADSLADVCIAASPNFDYGRFMAACKAAKVAA